MTRFRNAFLALIFALGCSWVFQASAPRFPQRTPASPESPCHWDASAQVIYFPQLHWPPHSESVSAELFQPILAAQSALAQIILEHPEFAIFSEGFSADQLASQIDPSDETVAEARRLFPNVRTGNARPESFDLGALGFAAGTFLARHGAVGTLFLLGVVKVVHKTLTVDEGNANNDAVNARIAELPQGTRLAEDPVLKKLIFSDREAYASQEILHYLKRHPTQKALLVFGKSHDFAPYFTSLHFARAKCE